MNKETQVQRLMDFLESPAYREDPDRLNDFLTTHPECRDAWEELQAGWHVVESTPLPAPPVGGSWQDIMNAHLAESHSPKTISITVPRWTLAAACGIIGLMIGLLWPRPQATDESMAAMIEELRQNQLAMQVLLLQSPNATERMRAVSMTTKFPPVEETKDAWFNALKEDPSINVRMAALDVLVRDESGKNKFRLLEAMKSQESPMMRMAMADLMLSWGIEAALPTLRKWKQDPYSPTALREHLSKIVYELSNLNQI